MCYTAVLEEEEQLYPQPQRVAQMLITHGSSGHTFTFTDHT